MNNELINSLIEVTNEMGKLNDEIKDKGTYTITDMENELEDIEHKKHKIEREIQRVSDIIRDIGIIRSPRNIDRRFNNPLEVNSATRWYKYKDELYSTYGGRVCRNPYSDRTACFISSLILLLPAYIIMSVINSIVGEATAAMRLFRLSLSWMLLIEITFGIVSTITYVVVPNKRIKANYKRELVELSCRLEKLDETYKFYDDMIKSAKATAIRPKEVISSIKEKTNSKMKSEVEEVRSEILPNMIKQHRKKFGAILDKCDELLNLCGTDSSALNEVSQIYNIIMRETAEVVVKYGESEQATIEGLLDNFEGYVDRKISKYKSIKEVALNSDINALNNIFKSDY